jgi:DNA-binding response OmpR family regulator
LLHLIDMRKPESSKTDISVADAELEDSLSTNRLGTVLIVEDDSRMQNVLQRIFIAEHYDVLVADDGRKGLDLFEVRQPIAVLLDLMLPEISGRELCRRFKSLSSETPVIVISAIADVADKVHLLDLGADDYVTKPFSPRELMARVQAAIRRRLRPAPSTTYHFANCEVDFQKMKARRDGVPILLTSHEYRLLKFFTKHPERVLSREELLNEVWGYNCYPTTRTVDNQILKLRQKLEPDPSNPRHLLTVYGAGYRFVPKPDGKLPADESSS